MSIIFKYIPPEIIFSYLKATNNLPIVSVGCGNGVCEKILENEGITNLILVDPDPESFRPYPENESEYLKPNYPYVKDLIEDKPDIVGECTLFLCWPNPNDSTYDIESVNLLNPRFVVSFYETIGAAGGENFHAWLNTTGAPCEDLPCGKYDNYKNSINKIHKLFFKKKFKYNIPNNYKCEKEYIKCMHNKRNIHAIVLIKREDDVTDLSHVESKFIVY